MLTIRPGSFQSPEAAAAGGQVQDKSGEAGDLSANRRFLEVVEAEAGDVDITKSDVLVSVGRGIEDQENIEIAEELAQAMGAVVSCSRPIVDAKWLEKSRQVGTSGQTVKPKVYLAMGISGSFQHLGGLKGSPFIVAVNKNPESPHFSGGRRGHRGRHPGVHPRVDGKNPGGLNPPGRFEFHVSPTSTADHSERMSYEFEIYVISGLLIFFWYWRTISVSRPTGSAQRPLDQE